MDKHKAIAIPVTWKDGIPYFLIVHDRRYSEWTFVTGGCKRSEISYPVECALRELEEETRGLVNLKECYASYMQFEVKQNHYDTEFMSIYHVYIIDFDISEDDQKTLVRRFNEEKYKMENRELNFRKHYDENDAMAFDSIEGIKKRLTWPLITNELIKNPEFYEKLKESRTFYKI
jgi:8-oxo-dGTP pyrophosphatase MutT (NUDIX family)